MTSSPLPAPLPLSLKLRVGETPDEAPAVVGPVTGHAHLAPGSDVGAPRWEGEDLVAADVDNREALLVLAVRVAHEPPPVNESIDRLSDLDPLNLGLHRLPPLVHGHRPGERDQVTNTKRPGGHDPLGRRRQGDVVQAPIGALEHEVAPVLKLVRPAPADEPAGGPRPDL